MKANLIVLKLENNKKKNVCALIKYQVTRFICAIITKFHTNRRVENMEEIRKQLAFVN